MNANCIICSDLFEPSSELTTTRCGHIFHHVCLLQWLERSATCPHCRKTTSSKTIIRTYFNFSNADGITLDAGALQNKLDNAEFQLREKDRECCGLSEQNKQLLALIDTSEKKLAECEGSLKEKNATIKMLKEQITYLKTDSNEVKQLRKDKQHLATKIESLKYLQDIIEGTEAEVESMVQNMPDVKNLQTYIVVLKKSVIQSENKKKTLHGNIRVLQNDLQKMEAENNLLQSKIQLLESAQTHLEEKLKAQQTSSDKRCEDTVEESINLDSNSNRQNELHTSPSKIVIKNGSADTNSPYLNLKQSNTFYSKLQSKAQNSNPDAKLNFYILKDKTVSKFDRLKKGHLLNTMAEKRKQLETAFDGLGGHNKPDVFPGTSNLVNRNVDKSKKSRLSK